MKCLAEWTRGESFDTYKFSYDTVGLPGVSYDDDSDKTIDVENNAETNPYKGAKYLKIEADKILNAHSPSVFSYFLDGSRHVFKVDDIAYNGSVYPIIAGQIGVGCCGRKNKKLYRQHFLSQFVFSMPRYADYEGLPGFFDNLLEKINWHPKLAKRGIRFAEILRYEKKEKSDLENLAIARVQDHMIELEKKMVLEELVKRNLLDEEHWLVKDGSLQYRDMRSGTENLRSLNAIRSNYRFVVGVSKSFNPELCKTKKGKPIAPQIVNLNLYERTPAVKYSNEYSKDVAFAIWYLRIRDRMYTRAPFDGIVKVEKILTPEEETHGIDTELVDRISASLINERTPTCYGKDLRWANHLYPVYLTEAYLKSRYLSADMFLQLF